MGKLSRCLRVEAFRVENHRAKAVAVKAKEKWTDWRRTVAFSLQDLECCLAGGQGGIEDEEGKVSDGNRDSPERGPETSDFRR